MRIMFVAICAAMLVPVGSADAATVLITGSNRGLGLEFVKQYATRGDTVIATCRHPDKATELQALAAGNKNVVVETLDVSDDASIRTLAARYRDKPIDVLVNNAGISGAHDDQTLGSFDRKGFQDVMDVNSFAPLAVTEAFRDNIVASKGKKVVAVTSDLGSISHYGGMPRGPYSYRMSKAALNMGLQALGADLKAQGVSVAVLSPGAADTEMLAAYVAEYLGNKMPPEVKVNTPAQSVAGMIAVIDKLDPTQGSSGILRFDGTVMAW